MFSGEDRALQYMLAFDSLDPRKHYPVPYQRGRSLRNDLDITLDCCRALPVDQQAAYAAKCLDPAIQRLGEWFLNAQVAKPIERDPETIPPLEELTG